MTTERDADISPGLLSGLPHRWPNLRQLAQPYLARSYGDSDCWVLIRDLLHEGGYVSATAAPLEAMQAFTELWYHEDSVDPLSLVQPWDLCLMQHKDAWVEHPALVVEDNAIVHAHSTAGVVIEPLRRRRHRLFQLARLRVLM